MEEWGGSIDQALPQYKLDQLALFIEQHVTLSNVSSK
jgi:hypothetical protein